MKKQIKDIDIEHNSVLRQDLITLINTHNLENKSNTPDWLIADYLLKCLKVFNITVDHREQFYNNKSSKSSRFVIKSKDNTFLHITRSYQRITDHYFSDKSCGGKLYATSEEAEKDIKDIIEWENNHADFCKKYNFHYKDMDLTVKQIYL